MTNEKLSERDWAVRTWIYHHFVEHGRPPQHPEIASAFGTDAPEARATLRRLADAHTIFLEPGSEMIRMANPFSAVPTGFRVKSGAVSYFANCAWDALAIPAVLGRDAMIYARLEGPDLTVRIPVIHGQPRPDEDYLVHFTVPFARWYDDLIHT